MVRAAILVVLAVLAGGGGALVLAADPPPPVPYEDAGACPFECCVYRAWTAEKPTRARAERRRGAAVVFRVAKGEIVAALTGVVVTTRAGRAAVRAPTRIGDEVARPGDPVYLLHYLGEGVFKVWFRGRAAEIEVAQAEDSGPDARLQVTDPPQTTWWVQIRNARGQVGWTDEPERFSGADACG